MPGYSEVINVIGAMIIFSMIMLSANSMIMRNSIMQVEGELEQEVIALGQEIIDESLSKSFDEVTVDAKAPPSLIPGGFTGAGGLGSDTGEGNRTEFNDFDDYNGWQGSVQTAHGEFQLSSKVYYVDEVTNGDEITFKNASSQSTYKKIEVYVTSKYLTGKSGDSVQYKLEFVRNYYAD
jgi:hypothetical protein